VSYGVRCLLPFNFSESSGDMGMLGLEIERLMKGGRCFVKFPLLQTRISVRKGIEREVLAGRLDSAGRAPTPPPCDPPCTHDDDHQDDDASHVVSSFVVPLHPDVWSCMQEGILWA
jgi:hypothetical protein